MLKPEDMHEILKEVEEEWREACAQTGVTVAEDAGDTLIVIANKEYHVFRACLLILRAATHTEDPKEFFNDLLTHTLNRVTISTKAVDEFFNDLNQAINQNTSLKGSN